MELTIEQALQQGIAAHKEGKLQDAERLYRAILQSQPLHQDANHNLGVLAVSVNKVDAALPLFKTALEANPKIEQFWLSYIDSLIKTEKDDDAREALADAQQAGVTAAKLQILEEQLEFELPSSSHIPQQKISNPLHSHEDELLPAIGLREVGKYKEAQKTYVENSFEYSVNPNIKPDEIVQKWGKFKRDSLDLMISSDKSSESCSKAYLRSMLSFLLLL